MMRLKLRLRGVRRSSGEVSTIASRAWKRVTTSTVNASRVYVSDELHLVSLPQAGGQLKVEHEAVDLVVGLGADVALLRNGQVSFRRGDVGEFEPIAGLEDLEELGQVNASCSELAAASSSLTTRSANCSTGSHGRRRF